MRRRFRYKGKPKRMQLQNWHLEAGAAPAITTSIFTYAGVPAGDHKDAEVEISSFAKGGDSSLTVSFSELPSVLLAMISAKGEFMPGLSEPYLVKAVVDVNARRSEATEFTVSGSTPDTRTASLGKGDDEGWQVMSSQWIHATAAVKDAVRPIPQPDAHGGTGVTHFLQVPTDGYMLLTHAQALDRVSGVRFNSSAVPHGVCLCIVTACWSFVVHTLQYKSLPTKIQMQQESSSATIAE